MKRIKNFFTTIFELFVIIIGVTIIAIYLISRGE